MSSATNGLGCGVGHEVRISRAAWETYTLHPLPLSRRTHHYENCVTSKIEGCSQQKSSRRGVHNKPGHRHKSRTAGHRREPRLEWEGNSSGLL